MTKGFKITCAPGNIEGRTEGKEEMEEAFLSGRGKKVGIPDKENPVKLSRTPKSVLKGVCRSRVPITNYPHYGSDASDTSILFWEGTDDEVITVLDSLHGS